MVFFYYYNVGISIKQYNTVLSNVDLKLTLQGFNQSPAGVSITQHILCNIVVILHEVVTSPDCSIVKPLSSLLQDLQRPADSDAGSESCQVREIMMILRVSHILVVCHGRHRLSCK
jgi:hypothetical protein